MPAYMYLHGPKSQAATDSYLAPFFLPLVFLTFSRSSTVGPSSILTAACLLSLPLHLSRFQHRKYLLLSCVFPLCSFLPLNSLFLCWILFYFQFHLMCREGSCAWLCRHPQMPREGTKHPGVATSCPKWAFAIEFWPSTVAFHHWASQLHLLSPLFVNIYQRSLISTDAS